MAIRSPNTYSALRRTCCRLNTVLLDPALHRMERKGLGRSAKWETPKNGNREFKYYRLTAAGRKQLTREESKWKQLAEAIAQIMRPAAEIGHENVDPA